MASTSKMKAESIGGSSAILEERSRQAVIIGRTVSLALYWNTNFALILTADTIL